MTRYIKLEMDKTAKIYHERFKFQYIDLIKERSPHSGVKQPPRKEQSTTCIDFFFVYLRQIYSSKSTFQHLVFWQKC